MSKIIDVISTNNDKYCYWCGKLMNHKVGYEDHERWDEYTCNCDLAKLEDEFIKAIESMQYKLRMMKRLPSAYDKELELKIAQLKHEYSILKNKNF